MIVPVARSPLGVDRAADQRAAGGADDQAGGAVGTLAAIAAVGIPPDFAVVIAAAGDVRRWEVPERSGLRRQAPASSPRMKLPVVVASRNAAFVATTFVERSTLPRRITRC